MNGMFWATSPSVLGGWAAWVPIVVDWVFDHNYFMDTLDVQCLFQGLYTPDQALAGI